MGKSRGCIIRKNTKELRESLMSLRYRWLVKEKGANCIVTNPEILKGDYILLYTTNISNCFYI